MSCFFYPPHTYISLFEINLQFRPKRKRSERGDDDIESRVPSKRKRNDDLVPCLDIIAVSGSTDMLERGDDEIESRAPSKNDDSVPCSDIIAFSENKYLWMMEKKKTIMERKIKAQLDTEPTDSAMWMDKMMKTHQSEDFKRAMGLYLEDVNNSGGFDVRNKPPKGAPGHKIFRIYDPPNIVPKFYTVHALKCLSNLAISVYNQNKGTNYDNVQIMMAMGYGCRDENYNITFKASIPSENTVIFQTKACFILDRPYQIAEIKFVREFNSKGGEDESFVFGKDPEKLPLHLSELALEEYNLHQLSCSGFTMEQNDMYGGVKVLRCKKEIKSIYEPSTYSIKFEASLPKSTTVKNFRTKLLVSFSGSTAKFQIKHVKSKCPTN